jgi:hypothetical protein
MRPKDQKSKKYPSHASSKGAVVTYNISVELAVVGDE